MPERVTGEPVVFDDCRESDWTMFEAKGPDFAHMLENDFMSGELREKWVKQATSQLSASEGRDLEWYFAEAAAADKALDIFNDYSNLRRIFKFTVPAEVP